MATSPVQPLLGAVRRRLWRGQFITAVRVALWISAGLMLLAVAVHLAARRVPVGAVLWALAVLWASMMARAGWRRPSDPACALWTDRHLGGASAFTTLLETANGMRGTANAQAVRWLEQWATQRVPEGLHLLAERHESAHLSRPLLSMLVCAALATLVLTLPDLAPSSRMPPAASSASSSGDRPLPVAEASEPAELASEIASALRAAESPDAPERGGAGRASAAGPGKPDEGKGPATAQADAAPPGERAPARDASSGTAVDAPSTAGAAHATGAGSGREAGESRDDRADVGASRVLRGTIPVQRSELRASRPAAERQADMERLATYDEELSAQGAAAMRVDPAAAAATPPPAIESTQLTPTETSYVQAWMKASGRRR